MIFLTLSYDTLSYFSLHFLLVYKNITVAKTIAIRIFKFSDNIITIYETGRDSKSEDPIRQARQFFCRKFDSCAEKQKCEKRNRLSTAMFANALKRRRQGENSEHKQNKSKAIAHLIVEDLDLDVEKSDQELKKM